MMSKHHDTNWPQKCPHCNLVTNQPPAWVRIYDQLSAAKKSKRVRILRLRDVVDLLGVSRQRAHQILTQGVQLGALKKLRGSPPTYSKTPNGCMMYSQWKKHAPKKATQKVLMEIKTLGQQEPTVIPV